MDEARAWLEGIRSLAERDPKGATGQIDRTSAAFREAFVLGGPLHEEFRGAVLEMKRRLDPGRPQRAGILNPRTGIADVGQDLLDLAERSGITARWLR